MKNPVKGKVKTRLASTLGDEKALEIYKFILGHTARVVSETQQCDKAIFYSDFVDHDDLWNDTSPQKFLQSGKDLGERMSNAFDFAFGNGYDKVVVIGTDCLDLNSETIEEGFRNLQNDDIVIGPAVDGGYYLLGMKRLYKNLFENVPWSTESVFTNTVELITESHLNYHLLPVFRDMDTEEDLYFSHDFLNKKQI